MRRLQAGKVTAHHLPASWRRMSKTSRQNLVTAESEIRKSMDETSRLIVSMKRCTMRVNKVLQVDRSAVEL